MSNPLNKAQVKEILAKNGIKDIDQLASLIASNSSGNPLSDSINPIAGKDKDKDGDSWIIKVWKLMPSPNTKELPTALGGDIIKRSMKEHLAIKEGNVLKEREVIKGVNVKGVNIKDIKK